MTHPNVQLAVAYYEALNHRDFDVYDRLLTDDVVLRAPGGVRVQGKQAAAAFDQIWTSAFSDFTIVGGVHVADDDHVICHNRAMGTHDGTLVMPDGSQVPATGRRLDAGFFARFDIRDGRLATEEVYFDRMLLAEQLGLFLTHA